jgi:hypothetical protein
MSDREIKVLEMYNLHNFMSLETFLKGDNKPFRRIVTARLIKKMRSVYTATFDTKPGMMEVLPDFTNDVHTLVKFKKIYYIDYTVSKNCEAFDIDKFAADNNKYDVKMYPMLLKVDKFLTKFPFIETIAYHMKTFQGALGDPMVSVLKDMCRYKNTRMGKANYNITTEVKPEEVSVVNEAA